MGVKPLVLFSHADDANTRRSFSLLKNDRNREDEGRSDLKHRKLYKKDRAEIASGENPRNDVQFNL